MTKIFCDCCGSEGWSVTIKIPWYVAEHNSKPGSYADKKIRNSVEPISTRTVDYDLCATCTDNIYGGVMRAINEVAEERERRISR